MFVRQVSQKPTVRYEVRFDMGAGSLWVVSPDVRAISISRGLNTWPGAVEAGTCDVMLDDIMGIYSPLKPSVHNGFLRPNLPIDILATIADADTSLVSSYYLFRGLVDGITVDPAPEARTVTIQARDYWKQLQLRAISTSMMVEFNVSTILAVAFDAASIAVTQRSIDAISDIIPFAWFNRVQLASALGEFIDGAGYAAYVAANGIVRVRDRYFDIGGVGVGSYDQFSAFNFSLDDANLVNRFTATGQPRFHVPSQQVISPLGAMVTIPGSTNLEFFISYIDPRNQQPAPARNVVTALTSSTDFILNTNSAGAGSFLMSTASVRVTAFGEAAKVTIFNGNAALAYLTKLAIRGEPIITVPDVRMEVSVGSSQAIYGIRDAEITSRLFTLQSQLERRAVDILEQYDTPIPHVSVTLIDQFPDALILDLANVVTITNSHSGFFNDTFTIFQLNHEIRTDDVGMVHSMTLDLRPSRDLGDAFILDTDMLDIDRIGR